MTVYGWNLILWVLHILNPANPGVDCCGICAFITSFWIQIVAIFKARILSLTSLTSAGLTTLNVLDGTRDHVADIFCQMCRGCWYGRLIELEA